MLLCDLGPMYVKFACVFTNKDDKAIELFKVNTENLMFFEMRNSLSYLDININFMKLVYCNVDSKVFYL